MSYLQEVLQKIKGELLEKNQLRTEIHENMRRATSLSKQTILLLHQKKNAEAKTMIQNARDILERLRSLSKDYPEIIYGGMYSAALQEFSEANIFLTLVTSGSFVSPEEIGVPSVDYVLGLADVVGEFRRLMLDKIREDDVKGAQECLKIMDNVFIELLALDEAYMLVPGLRHKSDIARRIIETSRGDLTLEVRRKILGDLLKQLKDSKTQVGNGTQRAKE